MKRSEIEIECAKEALESAAKNLTAEATKLSSGGNLNLTIRIISTALSKIADAQSSLEVENRLENKNKENQVKFDPNW